MPVSSASEALTAVEFDAFMRDLGPFEAHPCLLVAVSGGADSLALLHLTSAWTRAHGGHVVAATVDHHLRDGSAREAAQVAGWAAALGIEHVTLAWTEPQPARGGIQRRARNARYRLLDGEARRRRILHVATGHHADDQAETILLRLGKGSGADGLAGMAPLTYLEHARLLRPLLAVPSSRLRSLCAGQAQDWVEDPSNDLDRFTRTRLRRLAPLLAQEGLDRDTLLAMGKRMASTRDVLEQATLQLLAESAVLHPQGYATLALHPLRDWHREIASRALARLLTCIGGDPYPPSGQAQQALAATVQSPGFCRATLANCLLERRDRDLLIMPECRSEPPELALSQGQARWNGFRIEAERPCRITRAGEAGDEAGTTPRHVARLQPAFVDAHGLAAVPTLGYFRDAEARWAFRARFCPQRALGTAHRPLSRVGATLF